MMNSNTTHTNMVDNISTMTDNNSINTDSQSFMTMHQTQLYEFYYKLFGELYKYMTTDLVDNNNNPYRNFIEYFTYCLYKEYGIKRKINKYNVMTEEELLAMSDDEKKIFGDNKYLLIQFYYEKSLTSYDKKNSIVQLCRHMLFDVASFSIVSLGITKSLDINDMFNELPPINEYGHKHVIIEKLYEGSMLVYNKGLSKFNYDIIHEGDTDDDNYHASKQFEISTRRKIGTSYFNNPGKTFNDMFNENNQLSGLDLSKIDESFLSDYCLVFNVEHNDNRIVNPNTRNFNTLVGVYKLPKITNNVIIDFINNKYYTDFKNVLYFVYNNITECSVFTFADKVFTDYHQSFNVPEVIQPFIGDIHGLNQLLQNMSQYLSTYDAGFMVLDYYSCTHAKYRNQSYKELLELKGHYPIGLNEKNKYNLFKLWWRLRNNKSINKFLSVFETSNGEYRNLFNSFYRLLVDLTNNLFTTYQHAFVKRLMPKQNIPYIFKPLCGDLHKNYLKKGAGIMLNDVITYVNSLTPSKLYWRLYYVEPEKNENNDTTNQEPVMESVLREPVMESVLQGPTDNSY